MKKQLLEILDLLEKGGATSSQEIQSTLRISQSNAARCLADLQDEIFSIGRGKNTRYAVGKPIGTLQSEQPISMVRDNGEIAQLGTLRYLAKSQMHFESENVSALFDVTLAQPLPWIISGLKPQGFLGRLVAQNMSTFGYSSNPDLWDSEAILFTATKTQDTPGALLIGHVDSIRPSVCFDIQSENARNQLDLIAADVANTLFAGSSAGGEQPKFLLFDGRGNSFVVKFSPPIGTPGGDRWSDLLVAESLCSETLAEFDFECAESKIIKTAKRTYLLSKRFDRIGGGLGRKHVVSIGSVHAEFLKGGYTNWPVSCFELARRGRLPNDHAEDVGSIFQFGRLVGNNDMHSGNASLFVEGDNLKEILMGHFKLAPVYDMLPMRWKPHPLMEIYPYEAFDADYSAIGLKVRKAAQCFWLKVSNHPDVSSALQAISVTMASKMGVTAAMLSASG